MHGDASGELDSARTALAEAAKAVLLMIAKVDQREAQLQEAMQREMQSLRQHTTDVRREVAAMTHDATMQIAEAAKRAVAPVAAEYGRAVSAASAQLQHASKAVWLWFATAGAVLLLTLGAGWIALGYYRHELARAADQLQRYQDAASVLQAFQASDASVCGGRLCVDIDPNGQRIGDKRQYRLVKPRP